MTSRFNMTAREWFRAHPGEFKTVHGFDKFIRRYRKRLKDARLLKPGGKQKGKPSRVHSAGLMAFLTAIRLKRGSVPEHGTAARYKRACRCDACKRAHTEYNKEYYRLHGRKNSHADKLAQHRYNAKRRAGKRGLFAQSIVGIRVHRARDE